MRIDPKQQSSSLRISELRLAISRAIGDTFPTESDAEQPHISEIITALMETAAYWLRQQIKHDLGIKESS